VSRLLVLLVDLYRRYLSPLLPPLCRFEPSCSCYARAALQRHGALKGSVLSIWRVLRCTPLTRGGTYDPVPEPGRWRTPPGRGDDHRQSAPRPPS